MTTPQTETSYAERKAIEWLAVLRSSSLTQEQEQQFFTWLESSPEHQKAFIEMDHLWQRGAALSQVRTPAFSSVFRGFWSGLNLWHGVGTATACLLFALVFLALPLNSPQELHFQTAGNERRQVQLPDGSSLHLNINSRVSVDMSDRRLRKVTLRKGEAFFRVSHNPKRPFKVNSANTEIVVLGTQFSVRSDHQQTLVTVVDGKVQVRPLDTSSPMKQDPVTLGPNQQTQISEQSVTVSSVDANQALAWRTGVLRFDGNTLLEVVKQLNRYYPNKVEIGDSTLETLKVVAVLPLDRDLTANLDLLESNLNLIAVTDPTSQTIRLLPLEAP